MGAQSPPPPPDEDWLTARTTSFQVVFPAHLEAVARAAADAGEEALQALAGWGDQGFGTLPARPIQLVVTDHVDRSNAFAGSISYPRIVVWARPPIHGPDALPHDDWLRLVMTHEVIHILHGETTGSLGRLLRQVMGRPPLLWPFFPALALPSWGLEGVAVAGESALTDGGRMHGTRLEALLAAKALEGRLERIDQVLGASPVHPGGERPYAYGGVFFHDLAEGRLAELVLPGGPDPARGGRAQGTPSPPASPVADWVVRQATRTNPLRLGATTREVTGRGLGDLHDLWAADLERRALARRDQAEARRPHLEPEPLGSSRRWAGHAVFHPGTGALAWAEADGIDGAALVVRPGGACPGGGEARRVARLAEPGPLAWDPGRPDRLWAVDPIPLDAWRTRSELVEVRAGGAAAGPGTGDGRRRRVITRDGRIASVDPVPGRGAAGGGLVVVREVPGANELVLLGDDGRPERILATARPDVLWAHPRVDPTGRWIAVVRWQVGGIWEVGLLPLDVGDGGNGAEEGFRVLDGGRAPRSAPAWGPAGRHLVWSSEAPGMSSLFGVEVDPASGRPSGAVRQVTDLPRAAALPAIDPEGSWLVFSTLGSDGWTLVRLPWAPELWFEPLPVDPRFFPEDGGEGPGVEGGREVARDRQAAGGPGPTPSGDGWEPRPWSGLPTLVPRHVLPVAAAGEGRVGTRVLPHRVGLSTGARDALGRTAWEARLLVPVGSRPGGAEVGAGVRRAGPLGGTLRLELSQGWSVPAHLVVQDGGAVEDGPPAGLDLAFLRVRERRVVLGLGGADPRDGWSTAGQVEVGGVAERRALVDGGGERVPGLQLLRPEIRFVEARSQLSIQAVRGGALSPGPRRGGAALLRARTRIDVGDRGDGPSASRHDLAGQLLGWVPAGRRGGSGLRMPGPVPGAGEPSAPQSPLQAGGGVHWRPDPVVALRVAAALGGGPGSGAGHLSAGGSAGELLGVRGTPSGLLPGRSAWAASAELRLPLVLVHRGVGTLPVHADRLFGVAFVDAGGARQGGASRTVLTAGLELVGTGSVGFAPLPPLRLGGAVRLAGPGQGEVALHVGMAWAY